MRSNYSENPVTLQIDYRSSVRGVYINVARAMILPDGLQEVLAEARHRDLSSQELPAWPLIGVFKREETTSMEIVILSALLRTSSEPGGISVPVICPGPLPALVRMIH